MLYILTVLMMAAIAYAYFREGLFTAFCMCVNILLAGLVAFNFWEPIAAALEPLIKGTIFDGLEDALCLVILFSLTLGLLRLATNSIANKEIDYHEALDRVGGAVFGLINGYLVSGFLLCVLQTLPWHQNFWDFEYRTADLEGGL